MWGYAFYLMLGVSALLVAGSAFATSKNRLGLAILAAMGAVFLTLGAVGIAVYGLYLS